jgi:uncharacterized protein (DUF697 family)
MKDMKSAAHKSTPETPATRSRRIHARKVKQTPDAQFVALLQRKCMRAASVGALTAAGESVPGLGRVLGLVFGELLDVKFLAKIQRELIEETFALYKVELPDAVQSVLVNKVQLLGTGASVASDALMRATLKRILGRIGGAVAARVLPLTAIVTSALSNAAVTYAIGKRAQAVARLRDAPIRGMPDAVRAFTGVDERRIYAWSVAAVKDSLGLIGKSFGRLAMSTLRKSTKRKRAKT